MAATKKTITITWNEQGEIFIETEGYAGTKCLDALKELEKHFGKADDIKMKRTTTMEVDRERENA
jgi:hypothetical protein